MGGPPLPVQQQPSYRSEFGRTLLAGSVSGCASVLACHPLDVLRIKLQTGSRTGATARSILREMVRTDGWTSLYRGFWGPFFAQALYKSVIFSTNSFVNRHVFTGHQRGSSVAVFSSGLVAGSVNAFFVSPVELVRTRQVFEASTSTLATVRVILSEPQGLAGFWKGLAPTVVRDGPGIGFYMLAFEFCKTTLHSQSDNSSSVALSTRIAAASCAGIAFWLWALPIDTLKTWIEASSPLAMQQGSSTSLPLTTSRILQDAASQRNRVQLLQQLFRAWPIALARGVPSAVVTLTTFDLLRP